RQTALCAVQVGLGVQGGDIGVQAQHVYVLQYSLVGPASLPSPSQGGRRATNLNPAAVNNPIAHPHPNKKPAAYAAGFGY
ncbi:hypothetical protein ACUXVY_22990, partial [Chromobacterium haemolyticum]|uniref:hypothetical protein n=1 Tax=Chromobacterium haemolyticum TaxID=394935 RepID=UPI0040575644